MAFSYGLQVRANALGSARPIMQISVTCPQCQSTYQLDPSMRGKRMRCKNTICQAVFEIKTNGEPQITDRSSPTAPPAGAVGRLQSLQTGTVDEILPVLPADTYEEPPPSASEPLSEVPVHAPAAPPVAEFTALPSAAAATAEASTGASAEASAMTPSAEAPSAEAPSAEAPSAETPSDDFNFPGDSEFPASEPAPAPAGALRELGPGNWDAPPVRPGSARAETEHGAFPARQFKTEISSAAGTQTLEAPVLERGLPKKSRHFRLVLMAVMLLVLGGLAGGGYLLVLGSQAGREAERSQKAMKLYEDQNFAEAAEAFQKLCNDYPRSRNWPHYDFMRELASVRDSVAPRVNVEENLQAWENVRQFLERYKNEPILKDRHGDVWHMLHALSKRFAVVAEEKHDPELLKLSDAIHKQAGNFQPPAGVQVRDEDEKLTREIARVQKSLAKHIERRQALDYLHRLLSRPSAASAREAREVADKFGLTSDPDAKRVLSEIVAAHRASIVFVPADPYEKRAPIVEDNVANLYFAPLIRKLVGAPAGGGMVLAQAGGVLYALEPERGEVRWTRRVGVDTSVLPLHVPATALLPERYLVLSSDTKSLTAVTAETGTVLWQAELGDVSLGQPVLVDNHVLVATRSGRVEEIEITEGKPQGYYHIGQALTVGGIRQPDTSLVYFPADSYCVYVLDVAKRTCAAVLYSGHAPGSLHTLPTIWNEEKAPAEGVTSRAGWMLMGLWRGGSEEEFAAYSLPILDPDQKPVPPALRTVGASWFAPWHDGEKLAWATDAGYLAAYGIRQKGNRDPLLFRLLKDDFLVSEDGERVRAHVVHVDAGNYWVLTRGRLHRLQATFTEQQGPSLVARWPQPPLLGSSLQAAQVQKSSDGATTLYVTTQLPGKPTALVSAIDAEKGDILWQRRLGLMCQGPITRSGGIIACSGTGGTWIINAGTLAADENMTWREAGTYFPAPPQDTDQRVLAHPDGIIRLSWSRTAPEVHISRWNLEGESQEALRVNLSAVPLGTPALTKKAVLLPLANGLVARVELESGSVVYGPNWRGVGVDEENPGHIIALENDDFLATDGGRGITRIHWGDAKLWESKAATESSNRITSAPVRVNRAQIVVADASDAEAGSYLTLLDSERLQPLRRWKLPGKITAGPFVRVDRIGCVVGKYRLVWLNPAKNEPLWEQSQNFVAEIVGEPEVIDGFVIVADLDGRIQALDPDSGQRVGDGYKLIANAPPAATPIALDPGHIFLPIMDGTVVLLPMDKVKRRE